MSPAARANEPSAAEYESLLALLSEAAATTTRHDFGAVVCEGLLSLLEPAVSVSYNEIGNDIDRTAAVIRPDPGPEWFAEHQSFYEAHMHENPLVALAATEGLPEPRDWVDVDPDRRFETTPLFRGFYAPLGIRSQLAFTFPGDGTIVGIAVNRDGTPFSDRERRLLGLAAPLIALAHRHAVATTAPLLRPAGAGLGDAWTPADQAIDVMVGRLRGRGLTDRQALVVAHAAVGATTRQLARTLGISDGTARKHLENAYARLGVTNRVAAAAVALGHGGLERSVPSHT
jgi:DNA-binding CsgD family transcriptional regulator